MKAVDSMIKVYYTSGSRSSSKLRKWLQLYHVPYVEKNLEKVSLTRNEIRQMLMNSESGTDDIISWHADFIQELAARNLNINDMSLSYVIHLIQEHPLMLRRPIVIKGNKMIVGFDEELLCKVIFGLGVEQVRAHDFPIF